MAAQAIRSTDTSQSLTPMSRKGHRLTRTQGSGNLRTAVQLPEGEDLQEWIAVHGKSTTDMPVRIAARQTVACVSGNAAELM